MTLRLAHPEGPVREDEMAGSRARDPAPLSPPHAFRQNPTEAAFFQPLPSLLTIVRSCTHSRTMYPHGFIFDVSSSHVPDSPLVGTAGYARTLGDTEVGPGVFAGP